MRAKFARIRAVTPQEIRQRVKGQLAAIVRFEDANRGSKGVAIENVARGIGASVAWVRRILDERGEVAVHAHLMLNVEAYFDDVIERERRAIDENYRKLRGGDAADNSGGLQDHPRRRTSDLADDYRRGGVRDGLYA